MNANQTIFKALRLHPAPKRDQLSALTTNSSRPFLAKIPIEFRLKIKLGLRHQIERKSNDFQGSPAPSGTEKTSTLRPHHQFITNSPRPFLIEIAIEFGLKIKVELRHQIERKSNDFQGSPAPFGTEKTSTLRPHHQFTTNSPRPVLIEIPIKFGLKNQTRTSTPHWTKI